MDTLAHEELLLRLIKNPNEATDEEMDTVRNLVIQFPYFQSARILLLKLQSLKNNEEFINELPLAAVYAGDRKKLYSFIHAPKTIEKENEVKDDTPVCKDEIEDRERELQIALPADAIIQEIASKPLLVNDVENVPSKSATFSFTDWFDKMSSLQTNQCISNTSNENDEVEKPVKPVRKASKGWSLIDSFLQEYTPPSGRPEMPRTLSTEVEDLTERTNDSEKEFITETLADIFIAQKNYDKAITIFKKLSLKYPEKNTYFASQIKKVKKLKKIE